MPYISVANSAKTSLKCRCKALARNDKVTHYFLFRGICTHKS